MSTQSSSSSSQAGGCGCLGFIIAAVLSYALNNSLGWSFLHGVCSWFYVLYALIIRSKEIIPALQSMFGVG